MPRTPFLLAGILALLASTTPLPAMDFAAPLDAIAAPAASVSPMDAPSKVKARLVADRASVAPGERFLLGIVLEHPEHWHTYWKNPGDAGSPTTVTWSETTGVKTEDWRYPAPRLYAQEDIRNFVYEGRAVILVPAIAPADARPGSTLKLRGTLDWLECDDSSCNPKSAELALDLPVAAAGTPANAELFAEAEAAIPEPAPAGVATLAAVTKNSATLRLAPGALNGRDLADARFFPASENNPAALVAVRPTVTPDGALEFNLTELGDEFAKTPQMAGVVTFGKGRALAIEAAPGATSAEATVTAPVSEVANTLPIGELILTLLFAFGGGVILNIMPCVFPVLGLKIYGFVNKAGSDKKGGALKHALVFAAGIVVSFWILAALIIAVKAGAGAWLGAPDGKIGWGFLQQIPAFNAIVAAIFLVMGLSMAGVFEFGTSVQNAAGSVEEREGYLGSFLSGVLATLVATPCTGPLMSPALGVAFAEGPATTLAIFTAIGLGLAVPFVVLAASPALLRKLPRPGAWMESFKQAMSFALFAAFAYFIWILLAQTDGLTPAWVMPSGLALLFAFVLLAIACWVYGRWCAPHRSDKARRNGYLVAGLFTLLAVVGTARQLVEKPEDAPASSTDAPVIVWENWSPATQERLLAEGRTVYIDFTAKWCASCLVNKRVYKNEAVIRAFADKKIVALRADWTHRDGIIADELAKYGRSAIPFNVVLKKGAAPVILPEILTEANVLEALNK